MKKVWIYTSSSNNRLTFGGEKIVEREGWTYLYYEGAQDNALVEKYVSGADEVGVGDNNPFYSNEVRLDLLHAILSLLDVKISYYGN